MKHSEYLSRHGGADVNELLERMEIVVDSEMNDILKWLLVRKTSICFAKAVWKMYKESKSLNKEN